MSVTNELTILPKAAPIITPTARSITFPLEIKSLNSLNIKYSPLKFFLFIINKNLGDVIHKGSGHNISLLEEFRAYYSNNKVNFVNRIDKLTSGLVIGAKNIKTAREIAKEIQIQKQRGV